MVYAVIIAGGMGVRFWPKSRKENPKQFLSTIGDTTMIQATVDRIKKFIPIENICIVSSKNYLEKMKKLMPEILDKNMFEEPMVKETAACMGLAAMQLMERDKNAIIISLPSDHIIGEKDKFINVLKKAIKVVKNNELIATLGIKPTRPEVAYGYIEKRNILDCREKINVYKVSRFVEKPNKEKAKSLLKTGNYYWNSGMYIFKAEHLINEIKKYIPDTYKILTKILDVIKNKEDFNKVKEYYSKLRPVSIDYGVMEKTDCICVLEADILWDDVGSWTALERFFEKDSNGNIVKGLSSRLDTKDCIIYGDTRLVATIGVDNLIIVDTGDVILICDKKKDQDIKNLVSTILQDEQLNKFL